MLFEKLYYQLLREYDEVQCGGVSWPYFYIKNSGTLVEHNLIEALKLGPMHTIIFTCNKNMTAKIRVFQKDGMEVMYDGSYSDSCLGFKEFYMPKVHDWLSETGNDFYIISFYPTTLPISLICFNLSVRKRAAK